jgi:hypothetical protein
MDEDRLSKASPCAIGRRNRGRAAARACGASRCGRDDDAAPISAPPASHRRVIGLPGGDVGCELCARRAQAGTAAALDLARTSCQYLAATWVVLTLGDP